MQIAQLTKAEEQVMQYLWDLKKAFLKDILELFPEPKPHTNTVSTILKVLKDNKAAIGLYEKLNYIDTKFNDDYLLMEKIL